MQNQYTLSTFFNLTDLDIQLRKEIRALFSEIGSPHKSKELIEEEIFKRMVNCQDITMIIRLCEADNVIRCYSSRAELNAYWDSIWGIYTSQALGESLKPQPTLSSFNLVLGYYYYNKAMNIRQQSEEPFSTLEIEWLNQAMVYSSIHAAIELNKLDYVMLEKEPSNDFYARAAIKRSTSIIDTHQAAAYTLLIEAYLNYMGYLSKDPEKLFLLEECMKAALEACEKLNEYLPSNKIEIENASFRGGLEQLTSLHLNDPKEIQNHLQMYFDSLLANLSDHSLSIGSCYGLKFASQ